MSKPNRILMPSDESQDDSQSEQEARKAFIKGSKVVDPLPPPAPVEYKRKPANIRFDPAILDKVDLAAKRRGMSRSAWIHYVCSEALKAEGL